MMSAATSRYEVLPAKHHAPSLALQRGDGAAEIGFARRGAATVLAHLYQRTPCRVLFPHAETGDLPLAVFLTTSGGLAGGDRLRLAVELGAGTSMIATSAAAEKIYRSLGADAEVDIGLDIADGAWLEWLPQETILFDRARLKRRIGVRIAPAGRLLAAEMLVFGRAAHGERFRQGLLHESWRVEQAGRLRWVDATRLEGDAAQAIDAAAGFGGAEAFATVTYIAPDAETHLSAARDWLETSACRAGVTLVNGILLARFIGEAGAVRRALAKYVGSLRQAACGLPAQLPRVWNI
jgi:urease accessory protein